jgi:hypothetical protein
MKTFIIAVSCIALGSLTLAKADDNNKKKKGQGAGGGGQVQQHQVVGQGHHLKQQANSPALHTNKLTTYNKTNNFNNPNFNRTVNKTHVTNTTAYKNTNNFNNPNFKTINKTHVTNTTVINKNIYAGKHFNLAGPNRSIPAVRFTAGVHIVGSNAWMGPRYVVFRNYSPVWHDRIWYANSYPNISFVFGAPYYWNAGYWYPAWGYEPNATYYYDGPIYASSPTVDPSQEVAQVQSVLHDQGYYQGEIDGVLGPLTRAAIASYQQDHGLYTTSAIDEPTLESLGLT